MSIVFIYLSFVFIVFSLSISSISFHMNATFSSIACGITIVAYEHNGLLLQTPQKQWQQHNYIHIHKCYIFLFMYVSMFGGKNNAHSGKGYLQRTGSAYVVS